MKLSVFLSACVLALLQAPAAAEGSSVSHGAAMARIDFKVTIPHSLRVSLAQLENSANALRVALTIASNNGQVTIADTLNGHSKVLQPRCRAQLVQYRGVVTQAIPGDAGPAAAARLAMPAHARVEVFLVAVP